MKKAGKTRILFIREGRQGNRRKSERKERNIIISGHHKAGKVVERKHVSYLMRCVVSSLCVLRILYVSQLKGWLMAAEQERDTRRVTTNNSCVSGCLGTIVEVYLSTHKK